jgi:preprotein translocase subunit SecB
MEVKEQSQLRFIGVDILNVQFNSHMPAGSVEKMDIQVDCTPRVFFPKDNANIFHIVMDLELNSEIFFELSLRAVGTFELNYEITDELKKTFINVNAPAIMFPYVRSFVTTLTSNMGQVVGTLVMPTQFFNGILEELKD